MKKPIAARLVQMDTLKDQVAVTQVAVAIPEYR
jgi:hypothetical protein